MARLNMILDMLKQTAPYWGPFLCALVISLVLTPLVREMNRHLGMVDKPGGRRINIKPIPRGGGLAVILSFVIVAGVFAVLSDKPISPMVKDVLLWKIIALSLGLGVLGFADDMFGLKPVVKLLGQLGVAFLAFFWCNLGFHTFFPHIPLWIDLPLTVFWITGAINAFNLIDGLDGLSSGLAVIAATGMAGALFFVVSPGHTIIYFVFIGAVLGFLRYNFNPASVFLGDTGSMFLGFILSVLPLLTRAGGSFLVGIIVPLLAMGVPIFDTSLAIIRRTVRAVLYREENNGDTDGANVMQGDADHLHHRLLRKFMSQRKTAMLIYVFAAFLVIVGVGGVALRDRAGGLFIVAFIVGTVVVVKDMARVELLDVGRLADVMTHGHKEYSRRRRAAFAVPLFVAFDILMILVAWYLTVIIFGRPITPQSFHTFMPLRVVPVFFALVLFRVYSTVWSRAVLSNYVRMALAVIVGVMSSAAIMVLLGYKEGHILPFPFIHAGIVFAFLGLLRVLRPLLRDYFYLLNTLRFRDSPGTSRILVFGAGLRYRAFRRNLVRNILKEHRSIVGLVDDDILLRGKYIGGIKVDGPHMDAKRIVAETKADSVVIACELSPERFRAVVDSFKACGVKVSHFTFSEKPV